MSPDERAVFKLDEGLLGPVHWRSIERLYADQVRKRRRWLEQAGRPRTSGVDAQV